MSTWPSITVDEACCRIIDYRGKTPRKSPSGVRLVTAKVVKSGRINEEPAEYIAEDYYDEWMRRGLPELHDTVITTEAPLGEVGLIRTAGRIALGQRIILLRPDPAKMERRYLHQVLQTEVVQGRLLARATGTTVLGIKQSELRKVELPWPPLETQRRIAAILGAYDDLIEVNRRRVAVLEEMARGLFEEWFVRFRFPGHESAPMVETPDGPLPEGWSFGEARELVEFDPRTRVPQAGLKPFIPMGLLDTATSLIGPHETRDGNSGAKFQDGDTLFARITPCLENGKTGIVRGLGASGGVGFGSTEFIVMRGRRAGPAFTYCLSRLPSFRDHARGSMSGATGRQRARTDSVAGFQMAMPTEALLTSFEKAAWPMLEMVGTMGESAARLAASRDLLLPRVISGQLTVEAAERQLEEAA